MPTPGSEQVRVVCSHLYLTLQAVSKTTLSTRRALQWRLAACPTLSGASSTVRAQRAVMGSLGEGTPARYTTGINTCSVGYQHLQDTQQASTHAFCTTGINNCSVHNLYKYQQGTRQVLTPAGYTTPINTCSIQNRY